MGDPACKEQGCGRLRQIERIEEGIREKVTRVIEGHHNHHETTQQINRSDTLVYHR